ncbi:hypothetical protein [Citrobacter braakii]|uniref:hypothetical protein n=1 Tax=Citrobacter braakii TaxID=57706 RepID=UPI00133058F1
MVLRTLLVLELVGRVAEQANLSSKENLLLRLAPRLTSQLVLGGLAVLLVHHQ